MPSSSITDSIWPRLNACPDQFLVHRDHPIVPELYRPPDKSAWERLYEQYPRLSVVRHEQAVTFHISTHDIETVTAHVQEFVERLESVLKLPTPYLTTEPCHDAP